MIDISGRIKEMLIDGFPVSDICSEIGLKKTRVYEIIKEYDLGDFLKAKKTEAKEMLKNGEDISKVIKKTGISKKTVYRIIDEIGSYIPSSKRSKLSDKWVENIYKDIDKIATVFIYKNPTLNPNRDDLKCEILDFILKINERHDIELKENYFRGSIFKELNKYKEELKIRKSKFESLVNEDGENIDIPVHFDLDYALDKI